VQILYYDSELSLRDIYDKIVLELGLTFIKSAFYSYEQNNRTERFKGVLINKVIKLRLLTNLLKKLWLEIFKSVKYLFNRSFNKSLN